MLRRFSVNFALLSMLLDGISVALCLRASAEIRPFLGTLAVIRFIEAPVVIPASLYLLFPVLWVVVFSALSMYDGRKFLRAADEIAALSLATLIASVSSAGILYFSYRDISRALFLVFVAATFVLCLLWRQMARTYFRTRVEAARASRRLLVVGCGPLGQAVAAQIRTAASESLALVGFVDDGYGDVQGLPVLGGLEEARDIIDRNQITDVVVALPYSAYARMAALIGRFEGLPVGVWVALGFFDLALYRTDIEDLAGIPMLDLRASAIDDYQRLVKRGFDLFFVVIALVPALPLMTLTALLILLDDGLPVLFRQQRVGENGRLFEMLKFRTMVRDAEALRGRVERRDAAGHLIHKSKDDPRVTRVGRFLRRLSLDELPQLFNVLAGTMSLVGPRPELPHLVEEYQPWQRKRFAVPPGLTGWWQISGRSEKPMHLHTEDDLYYIQNYSIWLDLQIMVRTIWVVLVGKGSY